MRKDFKNIDIYAAFQPANGAEWQKANGISADWKTPEHIEVKPVYTKEDLEGMEHLGYTIRKPSSHTRRCCIRVSPIVQYPPLLPPVGVWAVSQSQCGRSTSQSGYRSSPW